MKRTDQERIERELRRREKKVRVIDRKTTDADADSDADSDRPDASPSAYIQELLDTFHFDDQMIYNTQDDEDILELLMTMKEDLPEKDWDGVLRSAIRKTKVSQKDLAFTELKALLSEC